MGFGGFWWVLVGFGGFWWVFRWVFRWVLVGFELIGGRVWGGGRVVDVGVCCYVRVVGLWCEKEFNRVKVGGGGGGMMEEEDCGVEVI